MTNYTTALDIITTTTQELGIGAPNLAAGDLDATSVQLLSLLNSLGDEVLRAHDWQSLEKTMGFTGDGTSESFPMPDDYGRQVNQTQWATSDNRPMMGPDSPQAWSWNKYGIVAVGVWYRYRIVDGEYHVFPVPGDGEEFAMYYISKNWVKTAENTYANRVTDGSDTVLFDRRLMIAGLKAKFWAQKGFDSTSLSQEFTYMLDSEKAQTQGARVISLDGNGAHFLLNWNNVPDGSYYGV